MSRNLFGKVFLSRRSLQVALVVFTASAGVHAATFNSPNPSNASSLPTYIDFDDNNCPSNGSLTGSATNGGSGLTLSGSGTLQGFGNIGYICYMTMYWQGTGSGSLTSATIAPNFTLTVPADVTTTCTLTVFINGVQEAQYNCNLASPGGTFSLAAQNLPVPATLSTYSVRLAITASWTDLGTTTFSVNIPSATSIDIASVGGTPPTTTPAPSSLILGVSGILLVSLLGFGLGRRRAVFDSKSS